MMDWIQDYQDRFKDKPELANLKKDKFHGSVEINFSDGVSHGCKKHQGFKPTLTEGGQNV